MKKDKLAAVIVFLVILFIVFVFGLFIGKKLSPKTSKEGTIKESALKNQNKLPAGQNTKEQTPVSASDIKFAPISKLAALKKENAPKKPETKKEVKPKVETKIVYVKKPVYVYKYVTKKAPVKKSAASPFNSKVYYTIQVAALKNYAQAKTLADKLNSMGFFAYIVPISVSGKSVKAVYQQVRVGKFSTVNGAESIKNIISKKFKVKPYIIKVD
ncbi:MAG: SPOR domain-containing protein [bacterium]